MAVTTIEWSDAVWNPVIGCSRVSPGCERCYAERQAYRNAAMGIKRYEGLTRKVGPDIRWTNKVRTVPELLDWPLRKRKPMRIFVNSMSDLFHEDVPFDFIDSVFGVMALARQHTFQVLTKRPERMLEWSRLERGRTAPVECVSSAMLDNLEIVKRKPFDTEEAKLLAERSWPPPNVLLGVSVEDQARADERIPLLLATPATLHFLSLEPQLGPIDLGEFHPFRAHRYCDDALKVAKGILGGHIDWVICGGESGPGARPMHPDWARSLRDQCTAADVPFFFKQWGAWSPVQGPDTLFRVGKKSAGRVLDGRTHDEYPA